VFTFDPFAILAVIVGVVALIMAIKRDRRRPVVLSKEVELTTRIVQLENTVVTLQRLLYEKQTEIDVLTERVRVLERGIQITDVPEGKRLVLLAGIGDDAMLEVDLAALRKVQAQTNLRLSRLLPVSKASLERTLDRHRAAGTPVKFLHLAIHSGPEGLQFSDGIASGIWLSQHLAGVEIAVLAGCSGDQVADLLGVVPFVISMREEVLNREASKFTALFWTGVGQGLTASEAFERAIKLAPSAVAEFVELHM
jgi:hypothetical protein